MQYRYMLQFNRTDMPSAAVQIAIAIGFLPARRYASAGLCDSDVSVCPSVCPSATRRYCA